MVRAKSNPQVILRPQDLVVLLRLSLEKGPAPTYATLASEVCLTASEIHAALERATLAQLARKDAAGKRWRHGTALTPSMVRLPMSIPPSEYLMAPIVSSVRTRIGLAWKTSILIHSSLRFVRVGNLEFVNHY